MGQQILEEKDMKYVTLCLTLPFNESASDAIDMTNTVVNAVAALMPKNRLEVITV